MLRKTPLLGLRSEWLDLADPWLTVPKESMKGKGGQKRELSIPLAGWAAEQLPHPLPKSGYIWPNINSGRPTGNLTRTLQKLAEAAQVPTFSLHDLRATGNTWLANAGVEVRIRQYLMGHADGGPVISRYTKVTTDSVNRIREAVAVFDDIRSKNEKNVKSFFTGRRSA
jgi:integrase